MEENSEKKKKRGIFKTLKLSKRSLNNEVKALSPAHYEKYDTTLTVRNSV